MCLCHGFNGIKIVAREEAPEFLQRNSSTRFIFHGFRAISRNSHLSNSSYLNDPNGSSLSLSPFPSPSSELVKGSNELLKNAGGVMDGVQMMTFQQCLMTMFILNNEIINVWSHMIATIVFALVLPWHLSANAFEMWSHEWGVFFAGTALAFLGSSLYHLMNCRSQMHFEVYIRFDLMGITFGILSSSYLGITQAFRCYPYVSSTYQYLVIGLFCYGVWFQSSPYFASERYNLRRVLYYAALMAFGIIPSIHWAILVPLPESELFLWRVIVFYLIVAASVFFYVSCFPEIYYPGKFDFFFSSHQFWHVLIASATLWWYFVCFGFASYHQEYGCIE